MMMWMGLCSSLFNFCKHHVLLLPFSPSVPLVVSHWCVQDVPVSTFTLAVAHIHGLDAVRSKCLRLEIRSLTLYPIIPLQPLFRQSLEINHTMPMASWVVRSHPSRTVSKPGVTPNHRTTGRLAKNAPVKPPKRQLNMDLSWRWSRHKKKGVARCCRAWSVCVWNVDDVASRNSYIMMIYIPRSSAVCILWAPKGKNASWALGAILVLRGIFITFMCCGWFSKHKPI